MHGDGGGGGFSGGHSGAHSGGHGGPVSHHSPAHHPGHHRADGQVPPYGADPATDPHARHRRYRTPRGTVVRLVLFLGIAVIIMLFVVGVH